MKHVTIAVLGRLTLCSLAPSAWAQPIEVSVLVSNGNGADAVVRAGSFADTNYGTIDNLNFKYAPSDFNFTRKSYVRFDVSHVQGWVATAELDFVVIDSNAWNPPNSTLNVLLYGIPDAGLWGETAISWNSAPLNSTSSASSFLPPAQLLSSVFLADGVENGTLITFQSDMIIHFINSNTDGFVTFAISSIGDEVVSAANFASRENSEFAEPVLRITLGCSRADVTTQGAGIGDPGFGIPDGSITAGDLNFFVNAYITSDTSVADVTTQGAGQGDPSFGVPDGVVTTADIQYFVNLWTAGCP